MCFLHNDVIRFIDNSSYKEMWLKNLKYIAKQKRLNVFETAETF